MSETYIVVQFQFEGWHHWPGAVEPYKYLSHPHRHMFHVKAEKFVSHGDREIEIIELKHKMITWCEYQWGRIDSIKPEEYSTQSCEQMAERISKEFLLCSCQVLEDGENGAIYYAVNASTPNDVDLQLNTQAAKTGRVSSSKPHFIKATEVERTEFADTCSTKGVKGTTPPKRRFPGKLFWGTEAEGPHRGVRTLFVPGDMSPSSIITGIKKAVPEKPSWELINIYFGADNCYFDWSSLSRLLFSYSTLLKSRFNHIWVEHPIDKIGEPFRKTPANNRIFVVGMVTGYSRPSSDYYNFSKRISDKEIIWEENAEYDEQITQTWYTSLDDPLFEKDIAI